ncbi:cellulase family glycosylhydrolase [Fulvivirga sp. 29W222]|uniref:Cellulase family glycosylhydrolase n=1 Tax=Fulvivirga marina TaxID=2494733 RepID=A0A937FW80_9BACT|nr:cellulase family glycosylhydrolase [Fulvivirga marina]MBL6447179.1 cellulase family glycosylhydrolase [Fulvivirga marina]
MKFLNNEFRLWKLMFSEPLNNVWNDKKFMEKRSMKYLAHLGSLLIIICGITLPLSGCGDDEGGIIEKPQVELGVSDGTLDFEASGGSKELKVTSNALWKFNYDVNLWSRPNIQTSKGDVTVQITADANETTEARSMVLKLAGEGVDTIQITVNQAAGTIDPEPVEPELPDYIDPDNTDMRNLTSVQLTELMGVGWNLGNSLEAMIENGGILSGNETSWGNPVVSKTLIDSVKAAGFNTIRIPVSWSHMFDDPATYKISYAWKQRVEEVVNYALDNDMFVMINIHWDGGWMDHPTYDQQNAINERITMMWKQIAKFFRDYDDRLLFAGTNEVHEEGDFNAPTAEYAEVQNSFNQTFVNTVRATGGRNTYRHLIVQTYVTNIAYGVDHMTIPSDDTADRLMVEVHFYDPYQFALQNTDEISLWGAANAGSAAHAGWGDEDWVDEQFSNVKTNFVDKGYGVILGEYSPTLKTNPANSTYEEHVTSRNYYINYVTKTALTNGMVPVFWDNGHTGNYGSGLFNRNTGEIVHAGAVDAVISALGK